MLAVSMPRAPHAVGLILALYTPLVAYLFRAVQRTGDGAAYVLQAADGDALDRSVHAGWLVPLSAWVRLGEIAGLDPSAAANLASAGVMALGLALLWWLGRDVARQEGVPGADAWALLAPAVAAGSATVWDAALFCEIYGPLAVAVLATVALGRSGRPVGAACAFTLAVAIHPGALALAPGLLVLLWSGTPRDVVFAGLGSVLVLGWLLLLGDDGWYGPRGITAATLDRSPWQSLQAAWRLLARDLGLTALPLLLGAAVVVRADEGRRWVIGMLLCVLGAAIGLDRTSDNPGQLPALLLVCVLAPLAARAVARRHLRALAIGLLLLATLGVAEATTRHDRVARRAMRALEAHAAACAEPAPGSFRDQTLRTLACR